MGTGSHIKSKIENKFYKNPQFYFVWNFFEAKKYIACFKFLNIILH